MRRAVVFHLEADAVGSELHRCGGGSGQPAVAIASGSAVRKNQRRAPETSKRRHWPIGCARRSATAYSTSRIGAHADVARRHLDVLDQRAGIVQAAAPRDDAVAARVDRRRRHRRRLPDLGHQLGVADLASAQQLVDAPGVGRLRMAGERRAERDDAARLARVELGELARVDAAEAPADQADRLALLVGERADVVAATLDHAGARAEVEPLPPGLGDVAEARQVAAQRHGREVARGHPGKHHHRMTVAARQARQPRQRREAARRTRSARGPRAASGAHWEGAGRRDRSRRVTVRSSGIGEGTCASDAVKRNVRSC